MKAILANMGFVLQMAGILTIIPIISAFYFDQTSSIIALFITATAFMATGFALNALCERKELNFKESNALIFLAFFMLSLIGAIPYLYAGTFQGNIYERFTSSFFESASGFTTTGFSIIPDVSIVSSSILLYRGLTQFIGGVGIVLLLLAFFYPEVKLSSFSRSLGFGENQKIKRTFLIILIVYAAYSLLAGIAAFYLGKGDPVTITSIIFATISSGGFSPVANVASLLSGTFLGYIVIAGMLLAAMNFVAVAGLFKLKIMEFLKSEIPIFLITTTIAIAITFQLSGFSLYDSAFHAISMATTTGFGYLNLSGLGETAKMAFVAIMLLGGTSLSTAGGMKVYRLIIMLKAVKKTVFESIAGKEKSITAFGNEYSSMEVLQHMVVILLFIIVPFISASLLTTYGYGFADSLFESTSALTNTGMGIGIVSPQMGFGLEWLFITLMLLGRVEIIAVLIMLSGAKEIAKNN